LTNNLADGLQTASGGWAGEQAQSAALSADIGSDGTTFSQRKFGCHL